MASSIAIHNTQTIGAIEGYSRSHLSYPKTPSSLAPFQNGAENTEFNTSLFMEEVKKYPAIYNKFFKEYKNKFLESNRKEIRFGRF